jgi:hypothetical protein
VVGGVALGFFLGHGRSRDKFDEAVAVAFWRDGGDELLIV